MHTEPLLARVTFWSWGLVHCSEVQQNSLPCMNFVKELTLRCVAFVESELSSEIKKNHMSLMLVNKRRGFVDYKYPKLLRQFQISKANTFPRIFSTVYFLLSSFTVWIRYASQCVHRWVACLSQCFEVCDVFEKFFPDTSKILKICNSNEMR